MGKLANHESVSIYQFNEEEINLLMSRAEECALNWATKEGWPVGVIHSFVWAKGKIWITFAVNRHRAAAIKRDPRVSVIVSSRSDPHPDGPISQATCKGRAEFFDDRETLTWFYALLAKKNWPDDKRAEKEFYELLDSPLRTVIAVTPEKWITFNRTKLLAHRAGTLDESELSPPTSSDTIRLLREKAKRGIKADS